MTLSNQKLTGQCQCSQIKYRVNGKPITLYTCHCLDCQKQSSSAFGMSLWVAQKDFELISGELKFWSKQLPDGNLKKFAFCADCGTRIYHASEDEPKTISLKAGSLDDTSQLDPVGHIWTKRAQPWLNLNDGRISVNGEPDDFAELIKTWSLK